MYAISEQEGGRVVMVVAPTWTEAVMMAHQYHNRVVNQEVEKIDPNKWYPAPIAPEHSNKGHLFKCRLDTHGHHIAFLSTDARKEHEFDWDATGTGKRITHYRIVGKAY